MKRTTLYVAVASAALTGAALASTGGAQQQEPPTGNLDVVGLERESVLKFVDNPPRQGQRRPPSAGDIVTVVARLRDPSSRKIGVARASFVSVGGRRLNLVGTGTFSLPRGTITVQGRVVEKGPRDRSDTLAITGGTGAYEDAGGTLTTEERRGSIIRHFDFSG
jgi:hypothetical protein